VWSQGPSGDAEAVGESDDPLIEAAVESQRLTRTPLTAEEVDAMRTALADDASVTALAKQFGVHRATVWVKTM